MSAASLATSAAESTEMPTSAACKATASLTPSPRNAMSAPRRRATLMMRDFWSGLTRAKMVVSGMAAARASSLRCWSSDPVMTCRTSRSRSRHTLAATIPLSPVMILTSMPRCWSLAIDAPASGFGRSTKVKNPTSCRSRSSAGTARMASRGPSRGDCDDPGAVAEEAVERVVGEGRWIDAAGQDRLGSPLGEQQGVALGGAHERGDDLALVVEWDESEPLVRGWALRPPGEHAGLRRRPQRRVERIASHRTAGGDGRLVGEQAEEQRCRGRSTGRVQRLVEGDGAFGERAGLVREEHFDVAEVLDGDESFDEHLPAGQLSGAGRQADADDGRQQLRRDPDGDGQGEQQRLQQRAGQRDVDDEDRDREHGRHSHQQPGEVAQTHLEGGLGWPLAEPDRDLAERGRRTRSPPPPPHLSHGARPCP